MLRCASIAGIALAGVLCAGCAPVDRTGAQADPFVITLANAYWVPEVDPFVEAVESISDGTIQVEFVQPESIDTEADVVGFMRESGADLGLVPAREFDDLGVRDFEALLAPMLIDSFELERAVIESDIAAGMLRGLERIGLVGVDLIAGPIRYLVGVSGPLLAPEDLRDASVAIRKGAAVAEHSFASLDARPFGTWLGDPPQLRGVTGLEASIRDIAWLHIDAAAHSTVANIGLWPDPYVIVADKGSWARLPLEVRKVVQEAATSAGLRPAEQYDATDAEALSVICRRGRMPFVTASPAQRDALRASFGPTYAWLREDPATRSFLERISLIKESVGPGTGLACPAADQGVSAAGKRRTPLDGTWHSSVTREQLAESPLLQDGGEVETWGDTELRLDRGAVTLKHLDPTGLWTDKGTFEVEDDVLTLTFTSGDAAGEEFVVRWSIYRGELRLARDESLGVVPTVFLVNTWKRGPSGWGSLSRLQR